MPVHVTYPGVYIEEVPSGVRTITGVATSITAFVGRARRGPVNEPVVVNNFGDYERTFGGLATTDPMGYAVRDFYLNGGSQAIIVRLFAGATDGVATINAGTLALAASSPGAWGNKLRAEVDYDGITADVASQYSLTPGDLFNLSVFEKGTGPGGTNRLLERLVNLSVTDNSRRADRILDSQSQYVRVQPPLPAAIPADGSSGDANADGADSGPLGQLEYEGVVADKTGLHALEKADLFNLLCIPPDTRGGDVPVDVYKAAMQFCADHRALLIVDSPAAWSANKAQAAAKAVTGFSALGLNGIASRNAALYFPRVVESDPLREGQADTFVPCGIIAGVMARTDTQRGVWKAPAGLDATLNGPQALEVNLTDAENGMLNPLGVNCLRSFPVTGRVVWGARTLRGADQLADEYKYVPVRRLALFIEESLYRGTQWVVFEPNDEPLWAQIRLNVGAFMQNLFRQGAFQGKTPKEAYLVKCDNETTTQNDINLGIVNILVGFAPLKPAEFVIIKIQQLAGKIEV
ncbi:MAG TPA: phage tail sheath C-terminal domain-containing protein [Pyrinomonadaceae bacterium]|jgi:phage tail sheath protein FI